VGAGNDEAHLYRFAVILTGQRLNFTGHIAGAIARTRSPFGLVVLTRGEGGRAIAFGQIRVRAESAEAAEDA
jgi:hypothetical protein